MTKMRFTDMIQENKKDRSGLVMSLATAMFFAAGVLYLTLLLL